MYLFLKRWESKKYDDNLAGIVTGLAMKYSAVVNFVSLSYDVVIEKRTWYAYFKNVEAEGEVLYGSKGYTES